MYHITNSICKKRLKISSWKFTRWRRLNFSFINWIWIKIWFFALFKGQNLVFMRDQIFYCLSFLARKFKLVIWFSSKVKLDKNLTFAPVWRGQLVKLEQFLLNNFFDTPNLQEISAPWCQNSETCQTPDLPISKAVEETEYWYRVVAQS